MRDLDVDTSHDAANKEKFATDNLKPKSILAAQRAVWAELGVQGAQQKTKAQDFLIIGNPFEHNGKFYSRILNQEIGVKEYETPTTVPLSSSDLSPQVKVNIEGVPLAWEHVGDGETQVKEWHKNMGAEAKNGRVLFNLHYKDGWTALFHEPVHESAPDGGIGTSPRWLYEGYCELFATRIAARLGYQYTYTDGPYADYARETQKLIDFVTETYFARAYFLNDEWSYGLLAPIFYETVTMKALTPAIEQRYLPRPDFRTDVPTHIKTQIQAVARNPKPAWYKRWVTLYGRSDQMPDVPAPILPKLGGPGGTGGPGGMLKPGPGGMPKPGANVLSPGKLTGTLPPTNWAGDRT
jgi:hypothetical protein